MNCPFLQVLYGEEPLKINFGFFTSYRGRSLFQSAAAHVRKTNALLVLLYRPNGLKSSELSREKSSPYTQEIGEYQENKNRLGRSPTLSGQNLLSEIVGVHLNDFTERHTLPAIGFLQLDYFISSLISVKGLPLWITFTNRSPPSRSRRTSLSGSTP